MSLAGTLRRIVAGPDEEAATFAYECVACGAAFEEPRDRMQRIACPDCGGSNVRSAE
ncbi:hypothetical protein JCM17823_01190 [Halorubrum gandharaense]